MIEFLFLDLDDTILDFHKAERIALSKTIRQFGVEPTEEVLGRYHVINKWHWEQLEQGKLTRDEVLENRSVSCFGSWEWRRTRLPAPGLMRRICPWDTISVPARRKRWHA